MTDTPSTSTTKQAHLKQYLVQQVSDGNRYFKSKFIAEEIELSAKEVGALMVQLHESASELRIEKWSYSSATTWRIEPA